MLQISFHSVSVHNNMLYYAGCIVFIRKGSFERTSTLLIGKMYPRYPFIFEPPTEQLILAKEFPGLHDAAMVAESQTIKTK